MCCQWKSWKSVNILRAGCLCKSTRQRTATGKERKAWGKAPGWTSSAKPSGIVVGRSALPHGDPCSSLKPVANISSNGYWNESRKEKKGREEEIISEALLSLTRVFSSMESIASSRVSYTTGAFYTTFQTAVWVYSHAVSHLFDMTLRAVILQQPSFGNWLGWSSPSARRFSISFHKPPSDWVLRLVTKHMQVLQSSHSCLGPPKGLFSCLRALSETVFHGLRCKSTTLMRKNKSSWVMPGGCATPSLGSHTSCAKGISTNY